jgi:hypothetical protein
MESTVEQTLTFAESLPDDQPAHLPPLRLHDGELVPQVPAGPRDAGIGPAGRPRWRGNT